MLSRAVVALYSDPLIAESLACRGGTILHTVHLRPAGRFSEDIDLVQLESRDIGPMYMRAEGHTITRAAFEANLAGKMSDGGFRDDMRALLATDVVYDADQAYEAVRTAFLAHLPDVSGATPT